ncbi:MAG: hypothetical protein DRO01_03505 [Thermoproteota archaeon]|nr:MAG: hypothetical protein DRO01_03505 [Candidatus Korarchaeota archaeon]
MVKVYRIFRGEEGDCEAILEAREVYLEPWVDWLSEYTEKSDLVEKIEGDVEVAVDEVNRIVEVWDENEITIYPFTSLNKIVIAGISYRRWIEEGE